MKRILYILAVLVVSISLVSGMLIAALMSDRVETAAVGLVTAELSRALGTETRVGAIEYRFPARIAIKDVYIEDRQRDTLLYVGELYAHFRPLALRNNEIRFSHVRLSDVTANIYRLPDSTWNYALFALPEKDTTQVSESEPFRSLVSVRDIRLENIRLRYEDYQAVLTHAEMDLYTFSADELDAQIGELRGVVSAAGDKRQPHPAHFELESLKARMILNDSVFGFPTLSARLPHSRLDLSGIEMRFPATDTLPLSEVAHDISFALTFHEASLVPSDLALFVPRVQRLTRPITLNGVVGGTLDSLYFNNIAVRYNGRTLLEGNVSAVGAPDLKNPYLRANLKELHTNAARLQDFLSQLYGRPMYLPKEVHRLGDIHYRGLAEGRLHDMTLHGAFRTALGTISTDGTFVSDSAFTHMRYNARVAGNKFRLGRMLAIDKMGCITLDVRSNGNIDEGEVRGDVVAHVREMTYNDYTYNDLTFNGRYEPKRYQGQAAIDDPHLQVAFDGVVDMHDLNPEINFNLRCRHFDAQPLGNKDLRTSFALAVDLNGVDVDKMSGYLVLDSLFFATRSDSILMRQLTLLVEADDGNRKTFSLNSDYLHADLDGIFRYHDITPAFQAMMHHYLPSAIPSSGKQWEPVSFQLQANGERLRDIQRLFTAPITLSDHPSMRAKVMLREGAEPQLDFRFFAPGVRAASTPVHDLTITLSTVDTLRHAVQSQAGSGLALSISAEAMKMHTVLSTLAFRDTLLTHLTLRQQSDIDAELPEGWRNLSPRELQRALSSDLTFGERRRALLAAQRAGSYGGDIRFITHFSKYKHKPLVDLHFMPGMLQLKDSTYTLGESRITYCAADTTVQIDHFVFEGNGQHIRADGLASKRKQDTLAVDLRKINAAYVVPFFLPVQTISFNGLLSGRANIASLLNKPSIETKIHIDSLGLNNCYIGDAEVDLGIKDSLRFHADVYRTDRKVVDLDGKALFDQGAWELDMTTDSVPLAFVNHWTASVLQNLDGNATGHVVVGGKPGLTYVLLRAAAQNASFTLPWTGARYTIPEDTLVMDTTSIVFPNVRLRDSEGNKLEVNGAIYHDQFKDFQLDLHVDAHDALVFDDEQPGKMLRGHVYASGHVDVTGNEDDLVVDADTRTSRNSRFRLSVDNISSASSSSFIHFVEHPELSSDTIIETDLDNIDIVEKAQRDTSFHRSGRCQLKLGIEVTPQLVFQLVIGERNGDMIQARGTGALRLFYDTETGDVRLLGTYDIERGTLGYTIANMIRKEFTIGDGSTIIFSGNPGNPQLDVTAKYRVTANIKDLFGDDASQVATNRSNIPVLTCLHLSGALQEPTLSFSLEFPTSDQSVQQQVRQIINTDLFTSLFYRHRAD